MAKILEIPYSTYSNYENNNREPDANTLNKIAKGFKISINELLGISHYIENTSENSNIIRLDIIKTIKHLKYSITDLSRDKFDKIVESIVRTIDYEFYNIEKNKSKKE